MNQLERFQEIENCIELLEHKRQRLSLFTSEFQRLRDLVNTETVAVTDLEYRIQKLREGVNVLHFPTEPAVHGI